MKINQIFYAAVKPDNNIMTDGELDILGSDEKMITQDGIAYARSNGIKPEEVRIIKVKLVEIGA